MKDELVLFDRLFKEKPLEKWSSDQMQWGYSLTQDITEYLLSKNNDYFLDHLIALYPVVEDIPTEYGPLIEVLCNMQSYDLLKEICKRTSINVHHQYAFGVLIDKIIQDKNNSLFLYLAEQSSFDLSFINQSGYSVLHQLVIYSEPFLLRAILRKASFEQVMLKTSKKLSLCELAIKTFNNKIMHFLLDMFPDFLEPNQDTGSMTLLHYSVIFGNIDAAKFLLARYEYLINIKNLENKTPLDLSIETKSSICTLLLLEHGASRFFSKEDKDHLIIKAVSTGNGYLIDTLLDFFDLDINELTIDREPFIFYIEKNFPINIVSFIYNTPNLNFNRRNSHGQTLMHYAIQTENLNLVSVLMSNKSISFNLPNEDSQTPLEFLLTHFDHFNQNHQELLNLICHHPSVIIRSSIMTGMMWDILKEYQPDYCEKSNRLKNLLIFTNHDESSLLMEKPICQLNK